MVAGGLFAYRFFSVNKLTVTSEKVMAKALPVFTKEPLLSQNLSTVFNTVKAIAISEKNTLAITDGKTVKIIALNNSSLVATFSYKSAAQITRLAFSQDGQTLVTGDDRGSILVWQLGQTAPLYTFNQHSPLPIKSLDLAADGHTLVSADLGGDIFVWDLDSQKSHGLFGNSASVNSVVVSSELDLVESLQFEEDILIFADSSIPDDERERLNQKATEVIVKPVPWSELKNKDYFLE